MTTREPPADRDTCGHVRSATSLHGCRWAAGSAASSRVRARGWDARGSSPCSPTAVAVVDRDGRVPDGRARYPSVTPLVPAADWYEREIHDLFGVEPIGHPDLDPLVLPLGPGVAPPSAGIGDEFRSLAPRRASPLPPLVARRGHVHDPLRTGALRGLRVGRVPRRDAG